MKHWAAPIATIIATFAVAHAQNTLTPDSGRAGVGGAKFNVSVVNDSPQSIRFMLRPKDGTWTEYRLSPHEKSIYSCFGCGGSFEITVRTTDETVSYEITSGTLYAIRPDDVRHIYDVYKLP